MAHPTQIRPGLWRMPDGRVVAQPPGAPQPVASTSPLRPLTPSRGGTASQPAHKIPIPGEGGNFLGADAAARPDSAVDFFTLAQGMFPFFPTEMLQALAGLWGEVGDGGLALGLLRARRRDLYDKYYPGIYRDDGTFRMNESEYHATKDGYRQIFAEEGIDPARVEGKFVDLIKGDVSVNEARERLAITRRGIIQQAPQIREKYREFFGDAAERVWDLSDEALFVHAVDPKLGMEVLSRRVSLAQIGGQAARFGFSRSLGRVQELANAGLEGEQAQEFYGRAAAAVPTFQALSARYNNVDDPFDIEDFESALVFMNPEDRRQAESLIHQERSQFSPHGGFAQSREGGLSGLRAR